MGSWQVLPLRVRVDLRVMEMNEYSEFPEFPELELHHQMQFNVIHRTPFFWRVQGLHVCSGFSLHTPSHTDRTRKYCVPIYKYDIDTTVSATYKNFVIYKGSYFSDLWHKSSSFDKFSLVWSKARSMRHSVRIKTPNNGMVVSPVNHYTTWGEIGQR